MSTDLTAMLARLKARARPDQLEGMARYGMTVEKRLGVAVPVLRQIARETGKNHALARELWQSGYAEARILASMIDDPRQVTADQMEAWVRDFDSWDVCDQVCMNLFDKTGLAWSKVREWAGREEEFVKRAAFALIACLAWHAKSTPDEAFIGLLPVIRQGAADPRNFVKKAVSWALRHIGKRNRNLNRAAVEVAEELCASQVVPTRWIGKQAYRELTSATVLKRLQ